jgi:hypothetical protein
MVEHLEDTTIVRSERDNFIGNVHAGKRKADQL